MTDDHYLHDSFHENIEYYYERQGPITKPLVLIPDRNIVETTFAKTINETETYSFFHINHLTLKRGSYFSVFDIDILSTNPLDSIEHETLTRLAADPGHMCDYYKEHRAFHCFEGDDGELYAPFPAINGFVRYIS